MPTYAGGKGGGSGRRLGVRIRTLREGLGAAVCLDVLPEGVGEAARLGRVWVEEEGMGGGDGDVFLGGGGGIGSDNLPASGRSTLSLFRSGPAAPAGGGGGGGAVSRTCKGVADKTKFGDSCRISSIDPMSPPPLGAAALSFSFCPFSGFSPSVCVGAEKPTLSLLLSLLSLSFDASAPCCGCCGCCCDVDVRVKNFTLRLSRLSSNMGRYCDCGLKPDAAFRLVFSRMVSRSCCMRRGRAVSRTLHE